MERGRERWLVRAVLLVAAVPFVALALHQAHTDSPTFDEPVYIEAGLVAMLRHDLRFNDEHPPLAKVIAAVPVLFAHPVLPRLSRAPAKDEHEEAAAFVRAQDARGRLQRETELARLVPILEALACGLVIFRLGSVLFGEPAGVLGAVLWWWNPLTLGIGHVLGIDVPFTLAALLLPAPLAGAAPAVEETGHAGAGFGGGGRGAGVLGGAFGGVSGNGGPAVLGAQAAQRSGQAAGPHLRST